MNCTPSEPIDLMMVDGIKKENVMVREMKQT